MQNRRKSPQNCQKSLQNRRKSPQNCRKSLQNRRKSPQNRRKSLQNRCRIDQELLFLNATTCKESVSSMRCCSSL